MLAELDDLNEGTDPDRISAEWDFWIRNNYADPPSGYTGVPRLIYGREDQQKIRTMRITLNEYGDIDGKHAADYLPNAGTARTSPFLAINRSKYHNPEENHAFAVTDGGLNANALYKLAIEPPPYYDIDTWSDPQSLEQVATRPRSVIARALGMPRFLWHLPGTIPDTNVVEIVSNTSELEEYALDEYPCLTFNPAEGNYGGGDYLDTWLTYRNVFIAFVAPGGDPGPEWDMDCDGVKYIEDNQGNEIRDPGDLVPTIVFKQIDP